MSSENKDYDRELKEPFEAHQIEWRPSRAGIKNNKPWVVVVPYIKSRAVQDRLDKVFGMGGWENEVEMVSPTGFLSKIKVLINGKWVTKCDGAEGSVSSNQDLIKSGASNAIKRAAVLLGIGRYLYDLDERFVDCEISEYWDHPYGNIYLDKKTNILVAWKTPELPNMALPGFDIQIYIQDMVKAETNKELDEHYANAKKAATLHNNKNMLKAANDAGEKRRGELKQIASLKVVEDTSQIKSWIELQIKSLYLVSNETSLTSVYEAIKRDLEQKSKDTIVDIEKFKQQLTKKYNSRMQTIKNRNLKNGN